MNQGGTSLVGVDRPLCHLRRRYQKRSGAATGEYLSGQSAPVGSGELLGRVSQRDAPDGGAFLVGGRKQQGIEGDLPEVHGGLPGPAACGEATKP